MRRFAHLDELERDETPKQRAARFFWDGLCVVISASIAWDISSFAIDYWDSGALSKLLVVLGLATLLAGLLWLAFRAGKLWWATVPMAIALVIPVVLHILEG